MPDDYLVAALTFIYEFFYLVLARCRYWQPISMKPVQLMRAPFPVLLFAIVVFFSCKKETEEIQTEPLTDYLPAQPGKFITYRLDSTVFTNFGTATSIRSYQEKNEVDALLTDNFGRSSHRVFRYLRDVAGIQAWRPSGTFFITPSANTIEVVENNLRYVKLASPLKQDFSWRGNRFLPSEPYRDRYQFSNDDDQEGDKSFPNWKYTYTNVGENLAINNRTYKDVVTVTEIDDVNLLDTINVVDNKVVVPALPKSKGIFLKGQATADIPILIPNQRDGTTFTVYNRANRPVVLNYISTPPGAARNYEYFNNNWRFANNKDTLMYNLPYGYINFSVRKYAKGIGLVYEELTMWEYQPNPGGLEGYRTGFGVKRSMIDHN